MVTGKAAGAATSDGRRLRWAEHRVTRRAQFVAAGAAAIDRFGPEASAEQIAEVAGVSRSVLYRYFRDRDDLRQAIADHVVTAVVGSVLPALALTEQSTPRQVISAAIGVVVGWFDEHPNLYHFLRGRGAGAPLRTVEVTLAGEVATLLQALMAALGIEAEHSEPTAYGIVGLVESSGAWWLSRRTISRDRLTALICRSVWHLLEGAARDLGVVIGYDDPIRLPGAPTARLS